MTAKRYKPRETQTTRKTVPEGDNKDETVAASILPAEAWINNGPTTWRPTGEELLAPVELPSQESLIVKLGPINLIERLNEYHADEDLANTSIGVFVGGIFGVVVNWLTSQPINASIPAILLIVFFLVGFVITFIWRRRLVKREKAVRDQLMSK